MAASDSGAEGGICFSGDQPPTAAGVTSRFPSDPGTTNVERRLDVTSAVTDDRREGGDIDKPYPGGGTAMPLLPQS